jgi:hypothetical protein
VLFIVRVSSCWWLLVFYASVKRKKPRARRLNHSRARPNIDARTVAGAAAGVVLVGRKKNPLPSHQNTMKTKLLTFGQIPSDLQKMNDTGAGAGADGRGAWVECVEWDCMGFPFWSSRRLSMVEPRRAWVENYVSAAGGGGGAVAGKGGGCSAVVVNDGDAARVVGYRARARAARASTRGGVAVNAVQADRASLFARDLIERPAGWRVPFGAFVEPSAVAPLFGGLPSGGFMGELQGQLDLALVARLASRLAVSMRRDGRDMSTTTEHDARSAGLVALARWRSINAKFSARRIRGTSAAVAWRAIVRAVADDGLGAGVSLVEPDLLCHLSTSALPLPQFSGDDSRLDHASRLLFERARERRPALLARRFEVLTAAAAGKGSGKRKASLEKLRTAAVAVLRGESLDHAAAEAGFVATVSTTRGGGTMRAGDKLLRAARRVGFNVQFDARIKGAAIARS